MIRKHDLVRAVGAVDEIDIPAGSLGTVVGVHADKPAYEVEFFKAAGATIGVITLAANRVRAVSERASVEKFRAALANVPDVEPAEYDKLI